MLRQLAEQRPEAPEVELFASTPWRNGGRFDEYVPVGDGGAREASRVESHALRYSLWDCESQRRHLLTQNEVSQTMLKEGRGRTFSSPMAVRHYTPVGKTTTLRCQMSERSHPPSFSNICGVVPRQDTRGHHVTVHLIVPSRGS